MDAYRRHGGSLILTEIQCFLNSYFTVVHDAQLPELQQDDSAIT